MTILRILFPLVVSVTFSHKAQAMDVTSPSSHYYIKILKKNDLRSFQICDKSSGEELCNRLGKHEWYATDDIYSHFYFLRAISPFGVATSVIAGLTFGFINVPVGITIIGVGTGLSVGLFVSTFDLKDEYIHDIDVEILGASDDQIRAIAETIHNTLNHL